MPKNIKPKTKRKTQGELKRERALKNRPAFPKPFNAPPPPPQTVQKIAAADNGC